MVIIAYQEDASSDMVCIRMISYESMVNHLMESE